MTAKSFYTNIKNNPWTALTWIVVILITIPANSMPSLGTASDDNI